MICMHFVLSMIIFVCIFCVQGLFGNTAASQTGGLFGNTANTSTATGFGTGTGLFGQPNAGFGNVGTQVIFFLKVSDLSAEIFLL